MPINLPGYYFDHRRNRYFPIGSKPKEDEGQRIQRFSERHDPVAKMLLQREINGSSPRSFSRSVVEASTSEPWTWKADSIAAGAALLSSDIDGFEVLFSGNHGGVARVYLCETNKTGRPGKPFRPRADWKSKPAPSALSCTSTIELGQPVTSIATTKTTPTLTLMSVLGGGDDAGGTLWLFEPTFSMDRIYSMTGEPVWTGETVWTADLFPCGTKASMGTNRGPGMVDLETMKIVWFGNISSSVLSQKVEQTGRVVWCGYRNGIIRPADVRETSKTKRTAIYPKAARMSSAVCSLLRLSSNQHHMITSAMDGSIWLLDDRFFRKHPVLEFNGHVNSSQMLHLAVDPTETLLASGGEDCAVRLWSLRSGKLLHTEPGFPSPIMTCSWRENQFEKDAPWNLWLGSKESIYVMQGDWRC